MERAESDGKITADKNESLGTGTGSPPQKILIVPAGTEPTFGRTLQSTIAPKATRNLSFMLGIRAQSNGTLTIYTTKKFLSQTYRFLTDYFPGEFLPQNLRGTWRERLNGRLSFRRGGELDFVYWRNILKKITESGEWVIIPVSNFRRFSG